MSFSVSDPASFLKVKCAISLMLKAMKGQQKVLTEWNWIFTK